MNVEDRLQELGIVLPKANPPAAIYCPGIQAGKLVFTAGQTPKAAIYRKAGAGSHGGGRTNGGPAVYSQLLGHPERYCRKLGPCETDCKADRFCQCNSVLYTALSGN